MKNSDYKVHMMLGDNTACGKIPLHHGSANAYFGVTPKYFKRYWKDIDCVKCKKHAVELAKRLGYTTLTEEVINLLGEKE
jgi:hypothetical protein